jgi:hypothetical protein
VTYDARQAALREQDAWVEACLASLCYSYHRKLLSRGAVVLEVCSHEWCHGVVDVLNRAYGNEHVSYRIPIEGDAAKMPA